MAPDERRFRVGDLDLTEREVQETLTALRTGTVDALVVQRPEGQTTVRTLQNAEHPFRLLVESMNEGAALLAGGGVVTYANRALERLLGAADGQLRGRVLRDAVIPEARAAFDDLLAAAHAERAARGEIDVFGADGAATPIMLSLSVAHLEDLPVLCAVVTDLAEQRRVEARYRAAKERIEARDRLVSVAGHELRSPLTALGLYLTRAARKAEAAGASWPGAHEIAESLRRADKQGVLLGQLVERLLDAAHLAPERLDLAVEELDLAGTVRTVLERLDEPIRTSGSAVTLALQSVVGRWDPLRIEQVVTNLLSNAVKYGCGRPIQVAVEADAAQARLVVSDRGIGVPPEAATRVFLPFERIHPDRAPGLGLGLYITREIVLAHGGEIRLDDRVREGATFVVTLPRRPVAG